MNEYQQLMAALDKADNDSRLENMQLALDVYRAYQKHIAECGEPLVMYLTTQQRLEAFPCKKCAATGYLDDAEPGDIYSNRWTCDDCNGTGYRLPGGDYE